MRIRTLLALVLLAVAPSASAFEPSEFPLTKLERVEKDIRGFEGFPKDDKSVVVDASLPPHASLVEYTGVSRKIPAERRELLEHVSRQLSNPGLPSMYDDEIEVKEGKNTYWVMIQKSVMPYLPKELKKGQAFRIFYRVAGIAKGRQIVYLGIEFDTAPPR